MNKIGLFEAKTKFSEICERVSAKGQTIVITRRGKPLVRIAPVSGLKTKSSSVWDRRAHYEKRHGRLTEDFVLPRREKRPAPSPFEH